MLLSNRHVLIKNVHCVSLLEYIRSFTYLLHCVYLRDLISGDFGDQMKVYDHFTKYVTHTDSTVNPVSVVLRSVTA